MGAAVVGVEAPGRGHPGRAVMASGAGERVADLGAPRGARAGSHRGRGTVGRGGAARLPRPCARRAGRARQRRATGASTRRRAPARLVRASAAIAIATAQSVEAERLRTRCAPSRARALGARAARRDAAGARRAQGDARRRRQTRDADGATERSIEAALARSTSRSATSRRLITELRPAALDELGLAPALEALLERRRRDVGRRRGRTRLRPGLDGTQDAARPESRARVYRLVQEALTNAIKHAGAEHVAVEVDEADGGDQA